MKSIYSYKDPLSFLKDFFQDKKDKDGEFSLRIWAKEMDLTSVAQLADILKGKKKIREGLIPKIIKGINLDKSEVMYFQAIVGRSQAGSPEKERMFDLLINELSPTKSNDFTAYHAEDLDIFSHWIYMAILSLSEIENIELSIDNILDNLREKVDKKIVEEAFFKLLSLGLLSYQGGKLIKTYKRNTHRYNVPSESIRNYYSLVCDLAKKAIPISMDEREFSCFSLPLAKDKLPLAKEVIKKCRNNLSALSEESSPEEVYQVNLVLFPLTKCS